MKFVRCLTVVVWSVAAASALHAQLPNNRCWNVGPYLLPKQPVVDYAKCPQDVDSQASFVPLPLPTYPSLTLNGERSGQLYLQFVWPP